jgi:hypothetical protein
MMADQSAATAWRNRIVRSGDAALSEIGALLGAGTDGSTDAE